MKDKFINVDEIQKELKELEILASDFTRSLSLTTQKIKYIVSKIKECETLRDANLYFNLLEGIQGVLACIAFKEELGLPDRLMHFINDFDNVENDKEYLYQMIKNDTYKF